MINIKDKLNRTNILIKRTNGVNVEYAPSDVFEADILDINGRIDNLEDVDVDDYVTKVDFDKQIDEIKKELGIKKIDATGFKFQQSTFTEFPDIFDFNNVSDFNNMFMNCNSLKTVKSVISTSKPNTMNSMFMNCSSLTTAPELDTLLCESMEGLFAYCTSLTTAPSYNLPMIGNLNEMYYGCKKLTEVGDICGYNGSNEENLTELHYVSNMFYFCTSLKVAPHIPTRYVTFFIEMFGGCTSLETVPEYDASNAVNIQNMFYGCENLTNFGGLKNLKIDCVNSGLEECYGLSYESLLNIINGLYNFRANGDNTTTRTIKLNYNSVGLLSDDDIAMATAKGWVISTSY